LPADVRIHLVEELATAAGYLGMVGGQAADVTLGASIHDPAVLERLHRLKTGALLRASVRMGGRAAGATVQQLDALTAYGDHVGLAFQLADDVLDADEAEDDDGPPSFVRLLGVDATRARAIELAERAVDAARTLESPVLEALARRIADRDV
ncbi:MAG: polyprenyl synthetase family protein, partial [Myxococcales bacterium]|nr:polyprenyl synthetase family protein [Myxococcales bacterium]